MQHETADLLAKSIRGVAELTVGERGLVPHRLPNSLKLYHDIDQQTQNVADRPSGVRIALQTSASRITLTYHATIDASEDGTYDAAPSVVTVTTGDFKQVVEHSNGTRRVWDTVGNSGLRAGENSVADFELPATDSPRLVEVWLPHNCAVEIVDLESDAPMAAAEVTHPRWVHYGSSISHCMEADEPTGVWPVVAARSLGLELFSLGLSGSANLEYAVGDFIGRQPADLISLKVGINIVNGAHMTKRSFVPAVHSFLDAIRAKHPSTPILLISPIFCGAHEQSPGPTRWGTDGRVSGSPKSDLDWVGELTLEIIRDLLAQIVERRGDANLHYLSGFELFGANDDHLMPDGLHPNAEGYALMGQRFANLPIVQGLI